MTPDAYEVVWTGSMEREACERIRAGADYSLPRHQARRYPGSHNSERVLLYLTKYPDVTAAHIAVAIGMDASTCRSTLITLASGGWVTASHRQRDHPRMHIRWRVAE